MLVGLLAVPALIPLLSIVVALLSPNTEIWSHLLKHVLPRVTLNTVTLVVGVGVLSAVVGTALAWLTSMCDFPGRKFFDWALLLPLAIPGYVLAFVAVGFLDFSGPLQTWVRGLLPTFQLPAIRSYGGVTLVLALALYPYVYLLARGAFVTQGVRALEAARNLGLSRKQAAWRVVLPAARPWIAAGVGLVCMETLADFGTVAVFNYDTFTTAIYRAWFGLFSAQTALQLSAVLMLFVIAAVVFERRSRGHAKFYSSGKQITAEHRLSLPRGRAIAATLFAATIFALGFGFPVLQLILWTVQRALPDLDARYASFALHSLVLASAAALLIVAASVVLAYLERQQPTTTRQWLSRIATSGYAIPGTVLAVGLLVPLILFNNVLQDALRLLFGETAPRVLLHGTLATVLLAYIARFMAVGFNPVDGGLQRITRNIDEAAIGLGVTGASLVRRIHLPLLRTGLFTAAALVFVDVMKEMPITLLTRPFGWDTLAVRVFEMTSEGEWERAALPSIAIVAAGLIPTALLTRRGSDVG